MKRWWTLGLSLLFAGPPAASEPEPREGTVIHEEWRGEYLGAKRIGYSFTTLEALPADGEIGGATRYRLTSCLGIPSQQIVSRVVAEIGDDYEVRLVRVESEAQGTRTEAEGSMVDGELVIRVLSSGAVTQRVVAAEEGIYLADAVPWLIVRRGVEPGERRAFPVFDPTVLTAGTMEVSVIGWEDWQGPRGSARALHAEAVYLGIPMELWLDSEGGLYESRTGIMNIRSLREPREELEDVAGFAELDQEALILEASIPSNRELEDPEGLGSLTIRLSGVPAGLEIPEDAWQEVVERTGEATVIRIGGKRGAGSAGAGSAGAAERYLEPSLLVQSEDGRIANKARELAGEASGATARARRIAEWISRTMKSELRVSTPSAAEILESMRGDCNEHATLFAALARSAGIPTKICAGLVYQEGRFFYHAWNEIYDPSEGWVGVDTAFGQFPADATHIKLAEGDLDEHVLIAQLVGKLEVEIVELEARP